MQEIAAVSVGEVLGTLELIPEDELHTHAEIIHSDFSLGLAPAEAGHRRDWHNKWLPFVLLDVTGLEQHVRWGV